MKFTAVIMAGGKGTRIKSMGEKPLVKIGGIEMFKRVVSVLTNSQKVRDIVIASSHHTPDTGREAKAMGLRVLSTPGLGYVEDLRCAVNNLRSDVFLVINADLPFITSQIIDEILRQYETAHKPALSVMAPSEKVRELGFEPTHSSRGLSPVGINVVDRSILKAKEVEQELLVIEDVLPLINVNSSEDVRRAEKLLELDAAQLRG